MQTIAKFIGSMRFRRYTAPNPEFAYFSNGTEHSTNKALKLKFISTESNCVESGYLQSIYNLLCACAIRKNFLTLHYGWTKAVESDL